MKENNKGIVKDERYIQNDKEAKSYSLELVIAFTQILMIVCLLKQDCKENFLTIINALIY